MVLTAPGIPLRLSAQTPNRNWCEFTVPHGFEYHLLQGKACGKGSKDFITATQALEAGKRQALGTEALIKVRSQSIPLLSQRHPWGRQASPLSHRLPPFYPRTTATTKSLVRTRALLRASSSRASSCGSTRGDDSTHVHPPRAVL